MQIKDIMTKEVIKASPDATVQEVAKLLEKHRINGVPVVDEENRVVGIVTARGLVSLYLPSYLNLLDRLFHLLDYDQFEAKAQEMAQTPVKDVMEEDVVCVEGKISVVEAAAIMVDQHIRQAPVIEDGYLVGIVTKSDIVKALAKYNINF
ncbi:MAG: CBS domain-containing protein [Halanaerobium sp.]|nr:CBS domain-containing protein [Halanaerobium sp.]